LYFTIAEKDFNAHPLFVATYVVLSQFLPASFTYSGTTYVTNSLRYLSTQDSMVWSPNDSTLYSLGAGDPGVNTRLVLFSSTDMGQSWYFVSALPNAPQFSSGDDLSLVKGPGSILYAVVTPNLTNTGNLTAFQFYKSSNNGNTWQNTPVVFPSLKSLSLPATLVVNDVGTIIYVVSGTYWNRAHPDVLVARSNDTGTTWVIPYPVIPALSNDTDDSDSALQISWLPGGKWVMVWERIGDFGIDPDIVALASADDGASWGPSATILVNSYGSSDTTFDQTPSIVSNGVDKFMAVWFGNPNYNGSGTDNDAFRSWSSNGFSWGPAEFVNPDAKTDSSAIADNRVHASHSNGVWFITYTVYNMTDYTVRGQMYTYSNSSTGPWYTTLLTTFRTDEVWRVVAADSLHTFFLAHYNTTNSVLSGDFLFGSPIPLLTLVLIPSGS
jgi:hypothetical protein